jgi:perosamine synthetase
LTREFVPVNEPLLDGNEKAYLIQCIESGWISSEGPFVSQFEKRMAALCGRRYGIAVANGTVALEAAVAALKIGPGDEVILPTFTIISCAGAIVRAGATPVVVDCDPRTWNMDAAQVEQKITSRTRAIMAVHIYGLPVDMDPIVDIARRHGLAVIEDAAQMHGQTYKGRPCGSFGEISTFSFYPNKLITAGEGGMIVTDDEQLAERSRSLRNLCFIPEQRFVHEELGFNFRMTNLQAAVGLAQCEKLADTIQRKRHIGARYAELLRGIEGIELPVDRTDYAESLYWVFGVVLKDDVPFDAKSAMKRLQGLGVGTRPFFWPMHEQPVFRRMGLFENESHPVAERIARRGFYLPSGVALRDEQIDAVAAAMRELLA